MTIILCPTCVGAGTVRRVRREGDEIVIETVTCYVCNGAGKINKYIIVDEEKDKGEK